MPALRRHQGQIPKRLVSGKRLILLVEAARICKEIEYRAREEAEKAAEEDGDKSKTISFGSGNSNSRAPTTIESVLRKGSRETIKPCQHELVINVLKSQDAVHKEEK